MLMLMMLLMMWQGWTQGHGGLRTATGLRSFHTTTSLPG